MMKRTLPPLLKATTPAQGAGLDNPYFPYARSGAPSTSGSKWQTHGDIRHPEDGRWGPTRYGGDEYPTPAQYLASMNDAHPTIEPLFHPKLTHKQKITRLYRRALKETVGLFPKRREDIGLWSYYVRQVRDEFEKNRNVDPGSAEWYFVRAVNYIESRKQFVGLNEDYNVGKTSHNRYARYHHPDEFSTFPHGFDPEEAYKLMNPYHRFGIPYLGRNLAFAQPHLYMMRPWTSFRPGPLDRLLYTVTACLSVVMTMGVISYATTGGIGTPEFSRDQQKFGGADGIRAPVNVTALA